MVHISVRAEIKVNFGYEANAIEGRGMVYTLNIVVGNPTCR